MRIVSNRKNIGAMLGDIPPPVSTMSPTVSLYSRERESPRTAGSSKSGKQMNRASIVSVMSALGVPVIENAAPRANNNQTSLDTTHLPTATTTTTTTEQQKKSSANASPISRGRKMYNFFGHRPPSELISSHLAEYFPAAKRKDLAKGARNSMLRLGNGSRNDDPTVRNSVGSSRLSTDTNLLPSRFSVASSNSSNRMSRASSFKHASTPPSAAIPEEERGGGTEPLAADLPRVSVSGDDGVEVRPYIDGDSKAPFSSDSSGGPPVLPHIPLSEDLMPDSSLTARRPSLALADRRSSIVSSKSRMSTISNLRRARRKSDVASLLTVDEITANVENRRASVVSLTESDGEIDQETQDAPAPLLGPDRVIVNAPYDPGLVPKEEDEDSEDVDDEEDSEESLEEEETDDDEDDEEDEDTAEEEDSQHGKAVTSTGSKRSIKWIKGALIGQGSFGKVYLGMDAEKGLLMAVKQVDLAIGGNGSEEKKQSMVTAMQQEIDLLKDLQHENIVQYLDSSTDQSHLNIFLEYVPGGSVSALLSNYGAFEEALVSNFVRQILTGLEYLHERNIIHRDIKGANILVDNKGGVKISDFGISKKVTNSE